MKNSKDTYLINDDLPKIVRFKQLSNMLMLDKSVLAYIVTFPEKNYREFNIPKRSGGIRIIQSPYPALQMVQCWILNNLLRNISLSDSSTGFISGKSILNNAKPHKDNKCLLKMDLCDFFPSIVLKRVIAIFINLGYDSKISYCLAKLCCVNGHLPQGAPTSPYISNIIAKRLDYRLKGLSNKFELRYTRYADDLAFSGEYISQNFIGHVEDIILDESFEVNKRKTKLIIGRGKKIVTGISISNGHLTLPRNKKRKLRKDAHFILKFGLQKHMSIVNDNDPIFLERLLGKFRFWQFIEPNNEYVEKTLRQLNEYGKGLDNLISR